MRGQTFSEFFLQMNRFFMNSLVPSIPEFLPAKLALKVEIHWLGWDFNFIDDGQTGRS